MLEEVGQLLQKPGGRHLAHSECAELARLEDDTGSSKPGVTSEEVKNAVINLRSDRLIGRAVARGTHVEDEASRMQRLCHSIRRQKDQCQLVTREW